MLHQPDCVHQPNCVHITVGLFLRFRLTLSDYCQHIPPVVCGLEGAGLVKYDIGLRFAKISRL